MPPFQIFQYTSGNPTASCSVHVNAMFFMLNVTVMSEAPELFAKRKYDETARHLELHPWNF